jgi:3-phenylpropionate/trans-cinnamate dioxygenase ferredoxin reductase subunit
MTDGATMRFDRLVLATGARPRSLDLPGAHLAGIHYLRTRDDAVALNAAIRQASRVAVIGAGWIGSEVAASARQMGADVVLIEPTAAPLHRVVGAEVGAVFTKLHADHGVELRLGGSVSELQGGRTVEKVVLSDGRVERADVVVVGIGVTPRTELAIAAGLPVDNGIVVDANLQTSVPGVFAAGDIANAWHPRYRRHLRVEHWANALNQGAAAGSNATGAVRAYDRLPYFYSDQYDLGLEYVGFADADHDVAIRGSLAEREFVAFYHRDGVVNAALTVNVWDVVEDLKTIVNAGVPVNVAALTDPDAPLVASRIG